MDTEYIEELQQDARSLLQSTKSFVQTYDWIIAQQHLYSIEQLNHCENQARHAITKLSALLPEPSLDDVLREQFVTLSQRLEALCHKAHQVTVRH